MTARPNRILGIIATAWMKNRTRGHGRLLSEKINTAIRGIRNRIVADNGQTGLFHRRSADDYVLLWKGREIARYDSIEAFVRAHVDGLAALEENQAEYLASFYRQT